MWWEYLVRQLAYLLRSARRFLRVRRPSLKDAASEILVLHPSEEGDLAPPITLNGHVDRATASFTGDLLESITYATMTSCTHAPTIAYRVKDVIYDNGCLYKGLLAEHVSSIGRPKCGVKRFVDAMYLCSSQSGSVYFGDWLLSDNLLEILAQHNHIEPLKIRPHTQYPHLDELNKLLGLQETYNEEITHIRNLYLISDIGYNNSKRKRLGILRENLRNNISPTGHENRRLVYITRGAKYRSNRGLVNEEDVIAFLSKKGALVVDPTLLTAGEILNRILGCSVVVGIEGSQLAYGFLALRQGGVMLTLQPPYRFQSSFRPRCESVGIGWGFIVGSEVDKGFVIDVDELEEVLRPYL